MSLSFDYWLSAEKWYEGYAGVVFGIGIFIIFAMCFVIPKRKTPFGKRFLSISAVVVAALGCFLLINNRRYEAYLEPASHVTPAIRTSEYTLFSGYQPKSRTQTDFYNRFHDPEGVEATGLYEKEKVIEELIYLGKEGRHHYFEHDGQVFRQYETSVYFDESADQTVLVGYLYYLKDNRFKTIGFQDTKYVFYDRIVINEKDEGKSYQVEDKSLAASTKEAFYDWTFPYY